MLDLDATVETEVSEALASRAAASRWRCGRVGPVRLRVEGCEGARCLRLWADVSLVGQTPEEVRHFRAELLSEAWVQEGADPAWHTPRSLSPTADTATAPLTYRVVELSSQEAAAAGAPFWRAYLEPERTAEEAPARMGAIEALQTGLSRWLEEDLGVGTVAGALRCIDAGPVGPYGPLRTYVLERSGQADLEFDGSLLVELDDREGDEGDPAKALGLYRARHGAWILHRRVREDPRRKKPVSPVVSFHCEVLVEDSPEALIATAGLARLEKNLFQEASLLPPERLEGTPATDTAAPESAVVDLARVPERSRRYVRALVDLAAAGHLAPPHLDALLRTARLFVRQR